MERLRIALAFLSGAFFALYEDSYLPVDYRATAPAFKEAGKPALMTVYANADAWDTSNVWFEQGRIRLYSKREKLTKMRYIDYGLMICTRQIFDDYPNERPVRFG